MKFDCDKFSDGLKRRRIAKAQKNKTWQRWFAWYPVRFGPNDCRWLETLERRAEYPWSDWIYRDPLNG